MKGRGGSAGLAAMLRQRIETSAPPDIVQKSLDSVPAPAAAPPAPAPPKPPAAPLAPAPPKPPVAPSAPAPQKPAAPAAPAPSTTYLPKTTSFTGTPKCCVCDKSVYKVEEIIALGRAWHDKCFRCGGRQPVGENPGCGRVLKRDGYLDHHSEPFCTACYNKLYRPKGFGFSNTLSTDYGPASESSSSKSESAENAASITPTPAAPTPAPPAPAPPVPAVPAPPVAAPAAAPPAPAPAAAPAPPAVRAPLAKISSFRTNDTPKCTMCAKSVYKVEELLAVNRVWHALCFTCGGSTSDGCGRVLKRDGYVDHDNQPFCTACYNKLYRPKGFGFSNTLSTDYGPASESSSSKSESAEKEKETEVTPAVPLPPAPAAPAAKPSAPVTASVPVAPAAVAIGVSSRALKDSSLHVEAHYVGDNDEVDESEW